MNVSETVRDTDIVTMTWTLYSRVSFWMTMS